MSLSPFEWAIITTVLGAAVAIISYFLKRTMSKTDSHTSDISHIKLTYVTKDEFKELKKELRQETSKLTKDITEIKENYLTKDDFIRIQAKTEDKLDRIYDLLIERKV